MNETNTLFPVLSLAKVKKPTETDRRLPSWLSHPIQFPAVNLIESGQDIEDFAQYIDDELRKFLKKNMLIDRMFPVQKCLIPNLAMQFESRPYRRPNDICVSSPTGSGKTLAYAIPIANYLNRTLCRSLRALIVLPTRDLALQVYKTFQQICTPTHLKCALAVGDGPDSKRGFFKKKLKRHGNEIDELGGISECSILKDQYHEMANNEEDEYASTIDILISTPGVLIDLMHNSTGFSLMDLEILVIDEADRLMTSYKHDWLNAIERSIFTNLPECPCRDDTIQRLSPTRSIMNHPCVMKKRRTCFSTVTSCTIQHSHESKPLHKLLFSATLSSDPQILLHMNLFQPRLFLATKPSITSTKIRNSLGSQNNTPISSPVPQQAANTRSELLTSTAIPEQLDEKMFIIEAKEKLFIMWYLLHELKYRKVICFTNQLATSFRLCKFLNEIHQIRAVEFSSNLKTESRQKYLSEFKSGRIEVIVSTDLMARGMDVEGVEYVISYDMPQSEIFYVHRVGRTARAGKKGTAITLVDTKQLVQFKKVVQLAHKMPNSMRLSDVVEEMKVPPSVKKSPEKYDLYVKTVENYEDKLSSLSKKGKFVRKPK